MVEVGVEFGGGGGEQGGGREIKLDKTAITTRKSA